MNETARLSCFIAALAAVSAFSYGCSGGHGGSGGENDPLPENTGAIVARLTNVPKDVQCVELRSSDYRTPYVRADVTPETSATIRLAPLSPGYVWLSGVAYNHPCDVWYYGDAGVNSDVTWEADQTYANVVPGQVTEAELHFHHLGGLDVNITFDDGQCDADASFGYDCDGGPPVFDAGPTDPPDTGVGAADAGFWLPVKH